MKKNFYLLALIISIFQCVNCIAQNYQCLTPENNNNNYILSQPSSCTNINNYIPDPSNNYENTPVITYKINIHLFRMTNGSGIYQYSDTSDFKTMVDQMNQIFTYIEAPILPVSPPAQEIDDSRVRVKLMGIYFHDNDTYYSSSSSDPCEDTYYDNFKINEENEINIFFYQNSNFSSSGCGHFPCVNMMNCTAGWGCAQLLDHELGHIMGLPHPGNCYGGSCNNDSFDDTYAPDCNGSFTNCGVNATSSCLSAIGISNNIMGYNMCRSYLSPKQMGTIHKNAISSYSYTKFIDCDYNSANSITISTNTSWDRSMIISGDLTVSNNSILTINCSLIMSDYSTITVNSGSALIIESDAILTGLCDNYWSGNLIVNQDGTLIIKTNGNINVNETGSFEIKDGGYICIESGAVINLLDYLSVINLRPGFISGINPSLNLSANCTADPTTITVSGNGEINTFTTDEFIQNITISTNKYYNGNNISAGYDVTALLPYGNVLINNNAHVILDAANDIILKNCVEIQSGCTFEMK